MLPPPRYEVILPCSNKSGFPQLFFGIPNLPSHFRSILHCTPKTHKLCRICQTRCLRGHVSAGVNAVLRKFTTELSAAEPPR